MKYFSSLFFFVVFIGVLIFYIIDSAFDRGVEIHNKFSGLDEAVTNIQYKATLAHLTLEELLSGDHTERIANVDGYMRAVKHYVQIIANEKIFKTNEDLQDIISTLEVNVSHFERLSLVRYSNKETSKIGSLADEEYDKLFKKILVGCSQIEYYVYTMDESAQDEYKTFKKILFSLFFFLMLLTLVYIYISSKKIKIETKIIIDTKNELDATLDVFGKNVIASRTDTKGTIVEASQAFLDISGYKKAEVIGVNHNIVRHDDMPSTLFQEIWETIQSGKEWKGEIKNKTKDGSFYWVYAYITASKDAQGKITGYQSIRHDITDKKYIEHISITDGLTNLYNRRHFDRLLPKEVNHSRRSQERLIFTMIDVDNFKKYNDNYGHKKGDEVLRAIAASLKSSFQRSHDMVFRLGGEEFGVIFSLKEGDGALVLVEKARKHIQNLAIEHTLNVNAVVTASFGVVEVYSDYTKSLEEEVESIYTQADEALYKAKEQGRNQVCLYSV